MASFPGLVQSHRPTKQVEYGPNTILTKKEVQERKEALQKVTDDQLLNCKKLLVEGGESLTALVVGDTGTGKSTLINTLLGKDIADVDSGPSAITKDIKHYTGNIGKVGITVVEVPHLEMEGIRMNTFKLRTDCPNGIDVVYVCQKLYERHTSSAVETLRRLSVVFGREIYAKAVFVMTFANDVPKSWGRKTDKETLRKMLERDWYDQATTIRAELQSNLHMTKEEAQKILILPAGYYDKDDPGSSRQILTLTNDWVYDLMLASVNANIAANRESSKSSSSSKKVAAPALLRVMASQVNQDFSGGTGFARDAQSAKSTSVGYGSKYSSSATYSSDHDCQFSGYVFEFLGGISQCLSDLDRCTFDKVVAMVREVATTIFYMAELCSAIEKILEAIYNSGALVAATVVVGAVAGLVVCTVSAIVIATLVITILSVILTILVAISMGLLVLYAGAVGAAVGGVVGGVIGTIVPGVGTAAGAAVGGFIGGAIGAGGTLAGFFGYGQ